MIASNSNEEDYLKKSLMNSFTKRRQRKGSLPEINAERAMMLGDTSGSFVAMDNTVCVDHLNDDDEPPMLQQHAHDLYYHPLTSTQETFATLHDDSVNIQQHNHHYPSPSHHSSNNYPTMVGAAASRRASRKSAFVLEVFRTSMFRSKSLTDLNSSLVKSENYGAHAAANTTNASNMSGGGFQQASYKNLTNLSNGMSSSRLNIPIHEK